MAIDYVADMAAEAQPTQPQSTGIDYVAEMNSSPEKERSLAAIEEGRSSQFAAGQAFYKGLLSFGASIVNAASYSAPLGHLIRNKVKGHVQSQTDIYNENVKNRPWLQAPELAGEMVGSAPLGPIFGAFGKAAPAVGKMLPTGLQTLGKYATAGAMGSVGAGVYGAAQYEPEQEGILNLNKAKEYASNPLSPIVGMGAQALSGWLGNTGRMAQRQNEGFGAKVLNRDLKSPKAKELADMAFESIPVIGGSAARHKQATQFIPATEKFIKAISQDIGNTAGRSGPDILNTAVTKSINSVSNRISKQEKQLWGPINDVQGKIVLGGTKVQTIQKSASDLLDALGAENSPSGRRLRKVITDNFLKPNKVTPTFETLKAAKSRVQEALANADDLLPSSYQQSHAFVKSLYSNLDDSIAAVNPALLDSYHTANAFTAAKHKMFQEAGPQLNKAIYDNANAYAFVKKLISEPSPTKIGGMLKPFNVEELNRMRAGIVAKHLKTSIDEVSGQLQLDKFLKATSQEKNSKEIMGSTYQMLNGLRTAMKPVQQAMQSAQSPESFTRAAQVGMPFAAGAAVAMNPAAGVGATASVLALNYLANNSPVKRALINITRAQNNPKLLEFLTRNIPNLFNRAGVSVVNNPDGSKALKAQDEED